MLHDFHLSFHEFHDNFRRCNTLLPRSRSFQSNTIRERTRVAVEKTTAKQSVIHVWEVCGLVWGSPMNSHRKNHSKQFHPLPHQTGKISAREESIEVLLFNRILRWQTTEQIGRCTNRCYYQVLFVVWAFPILAGGYEKFANVIRFSEHPTTGQRPTPPAWLSRTEIDATKAPRILSSTPWKWYLRAFCRWTQYLNMLKRWFQLMFCRVLKGGCFCCEIRLMEEIMHYLESWMCVDGDILHIVPWDSSPFLFLQMGLAWITQPYPTPKKSNPHRLGVETTLLEFPTTRSWNTHRVGSDEFPKCSLVVLVLGPEI